MSEFIECNRASDSLSPIYLRKSEIAAYSEFEGETHIWLRGMNDEFVSCESISEFQSKLYEVRG